MFWKSLPLSLLLITVIFGNAHSQTFQSGVWQTLFKDQSKNIHIEVKIDQKRDSCGNGMIHTHTYSYRMDPTYSQLSQYLIWKMDFVDCDGYYRSQYRTLELDPMWTSQGGEFENPNDKFVALEIKNPCYAASYSASPNNQSEILIVQSTPPSGINGSDYLIYGKSTQLSVKGGVLGYKASWVWYENQCGVGIPIGKGPSITVKPDTSTTYFVRAEGQTDTSVCTSLNIMVDTKSKEPQAVKVDSKIVCKGASANLTVEGGALGRNALWIWTKKSCDGPEVGRGASITVDINESTTYFVKAVGPENTTACASQAIQMLEPLADPVGITALSSSEICEGDLVQFKVNTGNGFNEGNWIWKTESCDYNGLKMGEGETVGFTATSSTSVFVYGENICGKTNCASTALSVRRLSLPAFSISAPSKIFKGRKYTLSVNGGRLGAGAQWKWYKDNVDTKAISTGESFTVKSRKKSTYFVRAEGACNTTSATSQTVYPLKSRKTEATFTSEDYPNKSYSFGLGIGVHGEGANVTASGFSPFLLDPITGTSFTDTINIVKSSYVVNLPIFPVMRKNISLGFIPEFNFSLVNAYGNSENAGEVFDIEYKEYTLRLVTDLAFGWNGLKLFGRYGVSLGKLYELEPYSESNFFDPVKSMLQYPGVIRNDDIHAGVRLGNYERINSIARHGKPKPTVWYDFYYIMRTTSVYEKDIDQPTELSFGEPTYGAGVSIWKQCRYKIIMEGIMLPESTDGYVFHTNGLAVTLGLQLCINGFR